MTATGDLALGLKLLIGDDDNDLAERLQDLVAAITVSVSSYLGLTVALTISGLPLTLTVMQDTERHPDLRASTVTIPLSLLGGAGAGGVMTFYAANPGAFIDLAADAAFSLGVPLDHIVTAENIQVPHDVPLLVGWTEITHVNQAIGALIGAGHTSAGAEAELQRLAQQHDTTVADAAWALVDAISSTPPA